VERNVAKLVRVPNGAADEKRVLTPDEVRAFLWHADDDRLGELLHVAVALGLRRGELLGLKWSDIDEEQRTIQVVRTVQRSGGSLRITEPKRRRSRRVLPLPSFALDALDRQKTWQAHERLAAGPAWHDEGWVFPSTIGTAMEPRNVNRAFETVREWAGMSWLSLHGLRHACGSYLLSQGVEHAHGDAGPRALDVPADDGHLQPRVA
jgi:integrase